MHSGTAVDVADGDVVVMIVLVEVDETEALVEPSVGVESEMAVEPEVSTDSDVVVDPEVVVEAKVLIELEAVVEAKVLIELEAVAELDVVEETEMAVPEVVVVWDVLLEVESLVELEPVVEPETVAALDKSDVVDRLFELDVLAGSGMLAVTLPVWLEVLATMDVLLELDPGLLLRLEETDELSMDPEMVADAIEVLENDEAVPEPEDMTVVDSVEVEVPVIDDANELDIAADTEPTDVLVPLSVPDEPVDTVVAMLPVDAEAVEEINTVVPLPDTRVVWVPAAVWDADIVGVLI